jgi:hypothetical protein
MADEKLHFAAKLKKGWPWTMGKVPPRSYEDCVMFFYACTDYQPPSKQLEGTVARVRDPKIPHLSQSNRDQSDAI